MESRVELSEEGVWYVILTVDGSEWAIEVQPAEVVLGTDQGREQCDSIDEERNRQ